ncbi:hypothetical protein H8B02_33840 [Bradyrhizobium sp. Pear77]|uniref:hypothetical protein n=1 Tax=Bradyrhizobium altum TaxID=1571202 RepID=UPI001E415472|nr:hypothetical protein [Bradyrhizobium altum]MCC8958222.1 hypothetical protein [Bradyrhizobium altum]
MGVGTAIDTTINGGRLTVDSGSTASSTTVSSNGELTVFGGITGDTSIDGHEESGEEIYGGTAINTTIKNGWLQYVSNDCNNNPGAYGSAVASNTAVEGGSEQIVGFLGAATAINTFVRSTSARGGICVLAFTNRPRW